MMEWLSDEDLDKLTDELIWQAKQVIKNQAKPDTSSEYPPKSDARKLLEKRVSNMGIDQHSGSFEPTIKQLQQYEDYVDRLTHDIKDEHGNRVFDQLTKLFDNIKSENTKYRHNIRWPVDVDHGYRLHSPAIATGIASVLSWETNPEMRAQDIKQEKLKQYVGNFEVTIIADGSWSMDPEHNGWEDRTLYQKQAIVLMFESLKKLETKSQNSRNPLINLFSIKTAVHVFWSKSRTVKSVWPWCTDAERLSIFKALNENDGPDNNEWVLLSQKYDEFMQQPQQYRDNIKQWKPKKIIFVLTDGWQDVASYQAKLEQAIEDYRNAWVVVYGLAMCDDADDVDEIYGTNNLLQWWSIHCGSPDKLWQSLSAIMKPHLLTFTTVQ